MSKLNDRQKEQIAQAMDLIIHVMREEEESGKHKRIVNALDKVTGELYNLLWD